jgi:metallo-beta-lactamase family protein
MKLSFLGAAETVTGSKYLVETGDSRILVDCGLFQGLKKLRDRNWRSLSVPPESLDAVVLTHAHIDHTGYLPRLVDRGFDGPVFCTTATKDLLGILLPDAGYLQEEEAKYANKRGFSKHDPAEPLYTQADARACLRLLKAVAFEETFQPVDGIDVRFHRAGHILGAAWIELFSEDHRLVFSGDIGRPNDPLMFPPKPIRQADTLVVESTYGDRMHPEVDVRDEIADIVGRTVERGGVVIIPAFAVGRSQLLMYYVTELIQAGRLPDVPVYLNSPMAVDVTGLYRRHIGDHRLDERACGEMCQAVRLVQDVEESKSLNALDEPAIIISASGMATGGRVIHHIKTYAPVAKHTILFAGYQAAGTRGEAMVNGASQVKIHGEYVPIRAQVENLGALSAHADYRELGDWLDGLERAPETVFLTHGELTAADAQRRHFRDRFGWDCIIPELDQTVVLDGSSVE